MKIAWVAALAFATTLIQASPTDKISKRKNSGKKNFVYIISDDQLVLHA